MAKGDVYKHESGFEITLSGDALREGTVIKSNGVYDVGHWSSHWSVESSPKSWTLIPSLNMEGIYKL